MPYDSRRLRGGGGVLKSQEIEELLRNLVANARYVDDFDRLPIPFRAVATDMMAGEMVVLGDGDLTLAMRARPTCTYALPFVAVRLRLQLAKVYWSLADHTTARHLLREVDDVLVHRPALGTLVDDVAEFRRQITAGGGTVRTGRSPLTPAELRLLPYLQTHLKFSEIAERLYVSRNTVSTQIGSIYRKLGVSSRNEAVEHATAVGLLGG